MAKVYIECDEFLSALLNLPCKMDGQGYEWLSRRSVWNMALAIPAADVREVVRCKDCVYHYYAVDCAGMCKLGIDNALLDDDFCSRGIRKGGADMRPSEELENLTYIPPEERSGVDDG